MGRYEEGSSGSREVFLRIGLIWAVLNEEGNLPSEKDRFASSAIKYEKSGLHDFIRMTGMMSIGHNVISVIRASESSG